MLRVSLLSEIVLFKPKMTRAAYNLYLQQSAGNNEDREESELSRQSEDSQNSQETTSSQEETALLNHQSRILDEAEQRHESTELAIDKRKFLLNRTLCDTIHS